MNGPNQNELDKCYKTLAEATVREANKPRPFWIYPASTVAGLPRLASSGAEFGGWGTIILISPFASGGRARSWKITSESSAKVAIPFAHRSGIRLLGLQPHVGVSIGKSTLPADVQESVVRNVTHRYGAFLAGQGISYDQIYALVGLFLALRNNIAFKGRWVPGWTQDSLRLVSGLAWSLVALSQSSFKEVLPGWAFPNELRISSRVEERGPSCTPSGIWGWPSEDSLVALRKVRGKISSQSVSTGLGVERAWNGSVVLSSLGVAPSGDPVADWREVGAYVAKRLGNISFDALDALDALGAADELVPLTSLRMAWRRLVSKHRHNSIPHIFHKLRYRDLVRDGRWDRSLLVPRLRAAQVSKERLPDVPLSRISTNQLLGSLRLRTKLQTEAEVLSLLENAVFGELVASGLAHGKKRPTEDELSSRWEKLLGAMPKPRYERRPMRKNNGGVRWLDVPRPMLAQVLEIIGKTLRSAFPPNSWACAFLPFRSPAWHARVHAGAQFAVIVDIADFFGSVRPRHITPWFGLQSSGIEQMDSVLLPWTKVGREAIVDLVFAADGHGHQWLPQGAATSPWIANLATVRLDVLAAIGSRRKFGEGIRYSRYADDLVLSMVDDCANVQPEELESFLRNVLRRGGWVINESKVRRWRRSDRQPLVACGIQVPTTATGACGLPGSTRRRARAAVHHLRRLDYTRDALVEASTRDRGVLSFAYAVTGDPAWLAYTSRPMWEFAVEAAGPVFAESLLAGVADAVDREKKL